MHLDPDLRKLGMMTPGMTVMTFPVMKRKQGNIPDRLAFSFLRETKKLTRQLAELCATLTALSLPPFCVMCLINVFYFVQGSINGEL